MEEPSSILRNGTPVTTHNKLNPTRGFLVQKRHLKAREPGAPGVIVGIAGGHGGDVYWVRHNDQSVGAYSWAEFEVAEAPVLKKTVDWSNPSQVSVDSITAGEDKRILDVMRAEVIDSAAKDPVRAVQMFEHMMHYLQEVKKNPAVEKSPAGQSFLPGLDALKKHQPVMAAIVAMESNNLRRLCPGDEPKKLSDVLAGR